MHSIPSPLRTMRLLPVIVAGTVIALTASCGGDEGREYTSNVDSENFATMTTRNVESLVSDSGITRYRIVAPLWLVYDEAREPRWRFPEGLRLERFDDFFTREATVECDSATYFKNKQLWRLDGHVSVVNTIGERFLTQQLYWDQRQQTVYSDSFIHIERADRVMEGYGFTSNQQMTRFKVNNVSAILPANQFRPGLTRTDSAAVNPPGAPRDSVSSNPEMS
ncbi:MAG: LPS export ABC transporter periplasmic protein LptC [Bacteroides sp.]|nr:LPS export ABC transporter periplasmic protein LptC [Bacteroides sp.]